MKFIRIITVFALLLTLCGCSKKKQTPVTSQAEQGQQTQNAENTDSEILYKNPLTGVETFDREQMLSARPVAVAINNQNQIRCHQVGLSKADIVYETYVEGGITRTLAIYKDISQVGEIGSIRSARYDFVDLACSNDALYVHAGVDYTYCQPYMNKLGLDDINLLEDRYYGYAYRPSIDHLLEHTLFSTGENISKMLADSNARMTTDEKHSKPWQNFVQTPKALAGGGATDINVVFSGDYKDNFLYDSQKGAYIKTGHRDGQKHSPAYTDELAFENVVVLQTTLGDRGDGYRVRVGMEGGSGYYFSQGTYMEINWKKGSTYDSFVFTDKDGNQIEYNPGKSWVCLVSRDMQGSVSFK